MLTRLAGLPLCLSLLTACAGDPSWNAQLRPAPGATVELGQPLSALLSALATPPDEASDVQLTELRVLQVDVEPWLPLTPDQAGSSRRVGVISARTCRSGGLLGVSAQQASWFLLVDGALLAMDHDDFGTACKVIPRFHPAPTEWSREEIGLVRYVAQRFPEDRPGPLNAARRGLGFVAAGRFEDANRVLGSADRQLEMWDVEQSNADWLSDEELTELREQEQLLRALRVKLSRALQQALAAEEAPAGSTLP